MDRSWRTLAFLHVVVLLGIVLVVNPLWLAPNGAGEYTKTYGVEPVENESTAQQALGLSEQVLGCPGERACELERRVLEEGPIEAEGAIFEEQRRYPVVRIDGDLYRPVERSESDETVLALEPQSPQEAVEAAAVPASEFGSDVTTAVETGSVTVAGEQVRPLERRVIFEHDDEFYYRTRYAFHGVYWADETVLPLLRGVLFAAGCALIAYAGWRYRGMGTASPPG